MKRLPIGVSEFKKIRTMNYYYADKSDFISRIYQDGSEVVLITRPRRFGKTLNMRMLYSFFSDQEQSAELFEGLKVTQDSEVMEALNAYPVIYLSFKDLKNRRWEDVYTGLCIAIADLYRSFDFLLPTLKEEEQDFFKRILSRKTEKKELENSVRTLSEFLYRYTDKPVIFLLDEYDIPIQAGYLYGFFD